MAYLMDSPMRERAAHAANSAILSLLFIFQFNIFNFDFGRGENVSGMVASGNLYAFLGHFILQSVTSTIVSKITRSGC